MADGQHAPGGLGSSDDRLTFRHRESQWLFDQQMRAVGEAFQRDRQVGHRRHRHRHQIRPHGRQQRAGRGEMRGAELLAGAFGGAGIGISQPDQFHAGQFAVNAAMVAAHGPRADDRRPQRSRAAHGVAPMRISCPQAAQVTGLVGVRPPGSRSPQEQT